MKQKLARMLAGFGLSVAVMSAAAANVPVVTAVSRQGQELIVGAAVPSGFRNAALEASGQVISGTRENLVAGGLNGNAAILTFRVPDLQKTTFLRVRLGTEDLVPPARYSGPGYFLVDYSGAGDLPLTVDEQTGHVLNRLAYGPSPEDLESVRSMGVDAYLEQQLQPETINESGNTELASREAALFTTLQASEDTFFIKKGDLFRYFKGVQAPPPDWRDLTFNASSWLSGPTGIGYGDEDDATVLTDMRAADGVPGYLTVYLRKTFSIGSPADLDALYLRLDYDDAFVAYLNGIEVARENVTGAPPRFDARSTTDHEAGTPVEYDLSPSRSLLRAGENVLAIQVHNVNLTSSDLTLIPELFSRKYLPIPPLKRIRGISELQQLVHVRGIYSRRQLQTVLAEFWENHLTTDYDKVAEYLSKLRNSDAQRAMSEDQAAAEAAHAQYTEYQFFYDHALGNFGDLLLYSATCPTQLIYLDNVLNVKGAPNENYAREILELFSFGVDNRYTQEDIEQLAKCFTGWTIRKVSPLSQQAFPASSRNPPTEASVLFDDTVLLDAGPGWRYFKGTREPSPAANGTPTDAWTAPDFDDTSWTAGSTGIGYGDGDDATTLADMRNGYLSVYLRREFTTGDPSSFETLLLTLDYDDGYVAYLNGTEIGRSETMAAAGLPPAYNRAARGSHEAGERVDTINLRQFLGLLKPAPERNVLAIQVHNISLDSSDLSLIPRLVSRRILPGSIENSDPNGTWTFRFNPARHDTAAKVLFRGTPQQIQIPAGRQGIDGLKDALDVVDTFVSHPSVSEFICLKLINKFVSDEITLATYKDGSTPEPLRRLMSDAIAAWNSTQPAGNIRTVMRAILSPESRNGYFWSRAAYRSKVKTPVEFINSSVRALRATVGGTSLGLSNEQLGMHLFTRDEPDGWSESGLDWIDTGTMLARLQFAQALSADRISGVRWNVLTWAGANHLTTAESVIAHFDHLLFQGKLSAANRELLLRFASTDDAGNPLPLDPARNDYAARLRELVGFILSMPQCHYQ